MRTLFSAVLAALALVGSGSALAQVDSSVVTIRLLHADSAFVTWEGRAPVHVGKESVHHVAVGKGSVRIAPMYGRTIASTTTIADKDSSFSSVASIGRYVNDEYVRLRLGADVALAVEQGRPVFSADGRQLGTGTQLVQVPEGGAVVHVGEGDRMRTVRLYPSDDRVVVQRAAVYPDRRAALWSLAVPGAYQHVTGRRYGLPMLAATTLSAWWTASAHLRLERHRADLSAAVERYTATTVEAALEPAFAEVTATRAEAVSAYDARRAGLVALGTLAGLHVLDVALRPYTGPWRAPIVVRPLLDPTSDAFGVQAVISLD
jgi:hypothetical protein